MVHTKKIRVEHREPLDRRVHKQHKASDCTHKTKTKKTRLTQCHFHTSVSDTKSSDEKDTIHLFASHIPYHPSDPRFTKTTIHRYSNLKRVPRGCNLPKLREKVFNLPTDRHTTMRVFYFVHIAKTGGVSVKCALRDIAYPQNSMCQPPQNLLVPSVKSKHYTRILSRGHLRARDIDPRLRTFAVLREPMARIKSAFQFIQEMGAHSEVWGRSNFTIHEMHNLFRRHRIRTISDIFTLSDTQVRTRILNHEHFRRMWDYVSDTHGNFIVDHVFLLETMRARTLVEHLHIQPIKLQHRNPSKASYDLTTTDKIHIRTHYTKDFQLYNAVARGEKEHPGAGLSLPTMQTLLPRPK